MGFVLNEDICVKVSTAYRNMIVILVKIISRLLRLGKLQDILALLPLFKATSVPKALFHSGVVDFVKDTRTSDKST